MTDLRGDGGAEGVSGTSPFGHKHPRDYTVLVVTGLASGPAALAFHAAYTEALARFPVVLGPSEPVLNGVTTFVVPPSGGHGELEDADRLARRDFRDFLQRLDPMPTWVEVSYGPGIGQCLAARWPLGQLLPGPWEDS